MLDETVPLPHGFYFCSLCRDVVGTLKAIFLPGVETVLSHWLCGGAEPAYMLCSLIDEQL